MTLLQEILRPSRHLISFSVGIIAGYLPNDKSNIHPLLMGIILALLFTKFLIGDYDKGYQWSYSDIVFFIITSLEGLLGASVSIFLK